MVAFLRERALDTPQDDKIKWIAGKWEIVLVDHKAHRTGTRPVEATRYHIGRKIEFGGNLQHAPPQIVGHSGLVIECAGHRGDRHAQLLGDILETRRDRHLTAPPDSTVR